MVTRRGLLFVGALLLANCSGGGSPGTGSPPTQKPSSAPSGTASPSASPSSSTSPSPTPSPPPVLASPNFRYYNFVGSYPNDVLAATDGNLWMSLGYTGEIAKVTTSGAVTTYPLSSGPVSSMLPENMAESTADGSLWISDRNSNQLSNLSLSGTVLATLSIGSPNGPLSIAYGPDGNLWFVQANLPAVVGQMTPSGTYTGYALEWTVNNIVTGPDGNLWLSSVNGVVRLTTSGVPTNYNIPIDGGPLCVGSDGNLWSATTNQSTGGVELLKISTSGSYQLYPIAGFLSQGVTINGKVYGWTPLTALCTAGSVYFTTAVAAIGPLSGFTSVMTQANLTGTVLAQYQIPETGSQLQSISSLAQGSDGNIWFVDTGNQTLDVWVK
jgi:streptogramin lyase